MCGGRAALLLVLQLGLLEQLAVLCLDLLRLLLVLVLRPLQLLLRLLAPRGTLIRNMGPTGEAPSANQSTARAAELPQRVLFGV